FAVDPAAATSQTVIESKPAIRPMSVLVVDDESDIREICRAYLEAEKHRVEEATDGEEALTKLGGFKYDLLLMDVKMPGRGGLSVMREMHTRKGPTPVVLMTGVVRAAPETSSMFPNLVAVLKKPFRRTELMECVERASSWTAPR